MQNVAKIMANVRSEIVFAVTVNAAYKDSLLNSLISAALKGNMNFNLDQILVISLDKEIKDFLERHEILSVYVPPSSLFNSSSKISAYGLVMFTRVSVVRLLIHWGFSVVLVDTDAIILKDPRPLFDRHASSSIVASSGKQPLTLYKIWNIAVCNGLLLIRSRQDTGMSCK